MQEDRRKEEPKQASKCRLQYPILTVILTHILIKVTTSHLTLIITLTLSATAATTFTLPLALTGSVTFTITLIAAKSHHQAITLTLNTCCIQSDLIYLTFAVKTENTLLPSAQL